MISNQHVVLRRYVQAARGISVLVAVALMVVSVVRCVEAELPGGRYVTIQRQTEFGIENVTGRFTFSPSNDVSGLNKWGRDLPKLGTLTDITTTGPFGLPAKGEVPLKLDVQQNPHGSWILCDGKNCGGATKEGQEVIDELLKERGEAEKKKKDEEKPEDKNKPVEHPKKKHDEEKCPKCGAPLIDGKCNTCGYGQDGQPKVGPKPGPGPGPGPAPGPNPGPPGGGGGMGGLGQVLGGLMGGLKGGQNQQGGQQFGQGQQVDDGSAAVIAVAKATAAAQATAAAKATEAAVATAGPAEATAAAEEARLDAQETAAAETTASAQQTAGAVSTAAARATAGERPGFFDE